jgi:hypothetical protein
MGAQGTATLDFGAFPGSSVASVDVAATGVISTSAVEAWIRPVASSDHTVEDHIIAPMRVVGQYLSDNNIRIYGINTNDVTPPMEPVIDDRPSTPVTVVARPLIRQERQRSPMFVGQFNVWWVWN